MGHKLIFGVNDLYSWCCNNGEYGKQLINEFSPENKKDIYNTFFGSTIKYKWICSKDNSHKWEATVGSRTTNRRGCPYCAGKKVMTGQNDLYTWCIENGEFGQRIIHEWKDSILKINEVSPFSAKDIHWKCSKGHEWNAKLYTRTRQKHGCPYCSGIRTSDENNLYAWIKNNKPFLLDEWIGKDSDGNYIDIHKIHSKSKIKVLWRCKYNNEHVWESTILNRVVNNSKCPYCINRKIIPGQNDLYTWCTKNIIGQKIINEWTGECIDGHKININNIAVSSNKIMIWKCSKDSSHEWKASIYDRTSRGTGCPYCNITGTSFGEQVIYRYYKQIYDNTISRGKFQGYEFDVAIPELKTCIEYNGAYWHSNANRIARDNEKVMLCKKHNVKLVTVIERDNIEDINNDNICVVSCNLHNINYMINIINQLNKLIGCNISDINKLERAMKEALEFMKGSN